LKFSPEVRAGEDGPDLGGLGDTGSGSAQQVARGTDPGHSFNGIRYGLAAIKNVGEAAMELTIGERDREGEFKSLEDFCGRLGTRVANRKMLESLVKAGAFDFAGRDRPELFDCIEESMTAAANAHRDRA